MFIEKFWFMPFSDYFGFGVTSCTATRMAWPVGSYFGFSPFEKNLDCTNALGMQSGAIPDIRLSASSTLNSYTGASLARLNLTEQGNYSGGWVAGAQASSQYLQIVFDATDTVLTAIATQGREDADEWVKKYYLRYKNSNWHNYKETGGIFDKVSTIQALSDTTL